MAFKTLDEAGLLSDATPLPASGAGSVGADNAAAHGLHVHPGEWKDEEGVVRASVVGNGDSGELTLTIFDANGDSLAQFAILPTGIAMKYGGEQAGTQLLINDNGSASVIDFDGNGWTLGADGSLSFSTAALTWSGATIATLPITAAGVDFSGLPTTDPETIGLLWVDPAADFVVKQSQGAP